jgi:hypothetical protein
MEKKFKLLVKFPTRGRKDLFFKVLDKYYEFLDDLDNTIFVVTCDLDDTEMNNESVIKKLESYKNLFFYFGNSKTKIEAINSDLDKHNDYDIILLASDDMIPQLEGYDKIIRDNMNKHYPDTDGVLWFYDGYRRDLNTLSILGKKYYDRFNYIYHPSYVSFYADNEFMLVAKNLNKQTYFNYCIIKHFHPDITKDVHSEYDETYKKNNVSGDQKIYYERKIKNFNIK